MRAALAANAGRFVNFDVTRKTIKAAGVEASRLIVHYSLQHGSSGSGSGAGGSAQLRAAARAYGTSALSTLSSQGIPPMDDSAVRTAIVTTDAYAPAGFVFLLGPCYDPEALQLGALRGTAHGTLESHANFLPLLPHGTRLARLEVTYSDQHLCMVGLQCTHALPAWVEVGGGGSSHPAPPLPPLPLLQ